MVTKERLSRETIVERAIVLADSEGLDAVTIRRLALDQGVTPMALYWHFRDKDLLLDGIAERLLSAVVLPPSGSSGSGTSGAVGSWLDRFRELLEAMVLELRAHPAVADLVKTRILLSQAGRDLTERALELLHEAGFSPEQSAQVSAQALTTIITLVTGEPGLEIGEDEDAREQRKRSKRAGLQALPPDRYPHLLAATEGFIACGSGEAYFALGLDLFIAGLRSISPHLAAQSR